MSFKSFTLLLGGTLHTYTTPIIMGILNVSPDSFYDGQRNEKEDFLKRADQMLAGGATILDIGGQSTRPGATRMSADEEWSRLKGKISAIHTRFPKAVISIDTFYGEVAQRAFDEGAQIINDVSAGSIDPTIITTASKLHCPYILMHMKGEPQTMHIHPHYDNATQELISFFSKKIKELHALNITDIILDPGFGFGKNIDHNFEIFRNLKDFHIHEKPVLVGISRKKMIQHVIEKDAESALIGTSSAHTIALLNGASILRVHDVEAAADVLAFVRYYQE